MSKTILVADDDPAIVHSVKMILEDEGYEVETTVNGKTVREVKDKLPDMILLDIWMSGMNGGDICRHLKSQEETRHIPIVMFSANRDGRNLALEAGADNFIAKPFDIDHLLIMAKEYAL